MSAWNALLEKKFVQEGRGLGPGNWVGWAQSSHLEHRCPQAWLLPCVHKLQARMKVSVSQNSDPLSPQTYLQWQWASRSWTQLPIPHEDFINVKDEQTDFPKANSFLHFLNECKCVCVGNFNKFIRTLELDKRSPKLVSRHKELFRKWLTFKATPKKDKDFVYSVRPPE